MSRSTLLRQWALLQAIPRHRDAAVTELHELIADAGFEATKRTIERDLLELEVSFPLKPNKKSRPYGWRWDPAAKIMDIPGMDPATALSFKLVEQHLERLMPRSTLEHLEPHFERATDVLEKTRGPLKSWTEKVRVIPRGQRLQEPTLQPGVLETVYQALLEEKQFKVRYRTKPGEEKEYRVHPLGLVLRDQVAYIVCTLFDYGDVLQLVLHRVQEAELLETIAERPKGFSLDAYIQANHFDYPEGEQIRLEALFEPLAARHLAETKLSDDQRLENAADGRVRLTATVADTQQLRWWLLGFGERVEVLGPASLRAELARIVGELMARYGGVEA
jgi:predicted DNA-binding transcriptional regulator YafY